MMSTRVLAVAGALILHAAAASADEPYKVIVHPANRISSLSANQLSRFFLETATWDDGQPVLPVDLLPDSPVRELFSKEVHRLSAASAVERWRPIAAAGGKTPLVVATDADVIQYVRLKLGAVGYVSARADVSGVKVVSIEKGAAAGPAMGAPDDLIQKALAAYVAALEARDVNALKRIWPGVTSAQERAIRAEFSHARELRVELLSPRIDVKEDQAVVTARRRYAITTTEGAKLQSESMTTLSFRRALSGWIVQDVRFRVEP